MDERDQRAAVAFLSASSSHGGSTVERLSTHGAHVFLAGAHAFKIKRAVDMGFFDFTTLERRRHFLEREFALNRRTAPRLYLGLRSVARGADGGLAWGESGRVVEWALEMRRFDQSTLFDRMAQDGRLTPRLIDLLADEVAVLHRGAEVRRDFGSAASYGAMVIDIAASRFAALRVFPEAATAGLLAAARAELARIAPLIDARREAGRVRHGHGDLHLRNICLFEDRPTLFDCLEFEDVFAITDTLYDLAFLIMDLLHRRQAGFAARTLGRYLAWTEDHAGLALMPFFLAARAMIRAHVTATMGERDEARVFFADAGRYLAPAKPMLVAIGGFSGTGKSTLAAALAPEIGAAPGAVVLRSDVVRKRLEGKAPEERLAPEAYGPGTSARVYETLRAQAAACLAAGHAAILDAVSARPEERRAFEETARRAGVPFVGLWLKGDAATLGARIEARRDDASDADVAVLRSQLSGAPDAEDWRQIDAGGDPPAVSARARQAIFDGRA